MKHKLNLSFIFSLVIMVMLFLSCGKIKEMLSDKNSKEETNKEETKKEETKKEDIKEDAKTDETGKENTRESDVNSETTKKNSNSKVSGKLYFCEDYLQDEEINVSDVFSIGRITVMVKTDEKIYDENVSLKLERIKENGDKEFVKTIKFTIPIGKYFYFKHKDLGFSKPGRYLVTMLGRDKSPIISGEVTITN
jgi:hypothetical protein